ncbi:hypothetical protein BRC83_02900 [Halobacteriales archaeon QS_1_68_17]|nr:MAG: hypothetical protein BRC83_02900 [Halobacteriales archaeon QS_1_68_17]
MSTATDIQDGTAYDYGLPILGGGSAGCSPGIVRGRDGLETALFDRGRSSLGRWAHLERDRGFNPGIDVGTVLDSLADPRLWSRLGIESGRGSSEANQ